MKVEIQISDELFARYELQSRARGISVKRELQERLEKFIDAPATDRVVLVRGHIRNEFEKLLNCSLSDDVDLLARVNRLASLSIGEHRLEFTPGQLAELKIRADKNGREFLDELKIAVKSVQSLVFDRI